MPIDIQADIQRPSPNEFAALAYDLKACEFAVHNEVGRFCDEMIYKRLVSKHFAGIELEVPVTVTFDDFRKCYFLDMVVRNQALFEWKAVQRLAPEHRGQLLNYLLLCDLPKGKLINVRPELIEHEFVNTTLRPDDCRSFQIECQHFRSLNDLDRTWCQFLTGALRDWGVGLDLHLYEAAIAHVFGGEEAVLSNIAILVDGVEIGHQKVRLTSSGAAFKVTALYGNETLFEQHAHRFLEHTSLPAIHWVNITRQCVSFKTLARQED
jgi:GxxExxY protein